MSRPGIRSWACDSSIERVSAAPIVSTRAAPRSRVSRWAAFGSLVSGRAVSASFPLLTAIFLTSCAPAPKRAPEGGARVETVAASPSAERIRAEAGSSATALRRVAEFPDEAFDLLAQSARDSCSICAERNRKKAFGQLDAFYSAGLVITSGPERAFLASSDDESPAELSFSSYARESPRLTLRFHTMTEHLVGVDTADYSDESWTEFLAAHPGAVLDGTVQLIAYPYGDGPTYLFSQTENHLQLQCKVLELSVR